MTNLTARQEQVFNLIKRYIDDSGYPPTRADIAKEFGFKSPNAAEEHLRSLQKKGVIEIIPGTSRGIRVNEDAGLPVYSLKRNSTTGPACIGHCEINPRFFSPKADCLVQLENQSFADLNLNKGDLLAVTKSNKAASQDLVIGELDGSFRLGILKKTRSKYLLKLSTGEKRTPEIEIDIKQQKWEIKGRVIGSIRNGL
ncbi:MAG: transcriptional repressor LexA [Pseudomonadales bacterium]|nr:transcriptional repressor LexA [Pseudomonadales bacterium]